MINMNEHATMFFIGWFFGLNIIIYNLYNQAPAEIRLWGLVIGSLFLYLGYIAMIRYFEE